MSGRYDYAHDEFGNVILIQYGTPPEEFRRRRPIMPVTTADLELIKERRREEEVERRVRAARLRLEAEEREQEERFMRENALRRPPKRALQLDD